MRIVLFFTSASRHSCRKRVEGAQRYFQDSDVQVQVVERNYQKVNIRRLLDFWNPVGCIAECGSGAEELTPHTFGSLPVVFLDGDSSIAPNGGYCVNPDLVGSAHMAARSLLSLGFADYGYVGCERPLFWSEIRSAAFREAIELNSRRCHVFDAGARHGTRRLAALGRWLEALPKPCGIFAAFDQTAETVLAECSQLGIKVPEEVAVLGVDNEEEICEHTKPTLSSICPDFEKAGWLCAEMLDMRMRDTPSMPRSRTYGILGIVRRRSTAIFNRHDPKVSDAVEFIRQHACEDISIEEIARRMGCCRRLAEIRFKAMTGRTIQEEIREMRMQKVFALLRRPNQAIDGIANLCGYASDSTLRYAFKARTGLSMREWRKKEEVY